MLPIAAAYDISPELIKELGQARILELMNTHAEGVVIDQAENHTDQSIRVTIEYMPHRPSEDY